LKRFSRAGVSAVEYREYTVHGKQILDIVLDKPLSREVFADLYKYLSDNNIQLIQIRAVQPVVRLIKVETSSTRYKLALTILSIIMIGLTGYGLSESFLSLERRIIALPELLFNTIIYTSLFIVVLLIHEFGHIYVSRKSGFKIEGPILIPAPPIQLGFLGTFGAVIFMKMLPPSRRDLAKLGISGPLMGFIAATIVGLIGLYLSPVIPVSKAIEMVESGGLSYTPISSMLLQVLLMMRSSSDMVVIMHPLLFIAYVMYLITFLNLLPIGQLDGGHVVRSFTSGEHHTRIGLATILSIFMISVLLLLQGNEAYMFYLGLGIVMILIYMFVARGQHPGWANQYDDSKCPLCLILYVMLLILTMPLPA